MIEHIRATDDPNRWCEGCGQDHGPLYICQHYPDDLKAEIQAKSDAWEAKLRAGDVLRQHGPVVDAIFRAFAGIGDDD